MHLFTVWCATLCRAFHCASMRGTRIYVYRVRGGATQAQQEQTPHVSGTCAFILRPLLNTNKLLTSWDRIVSDNDTRRTSK
jgi:hypothetical protein